MTSLDDYQREAAALSGAKRWLDTAARQPGRPDATPEQKKKAAEYALGRLKEAVK